MKLLVRYFSIIFLLSIFCATPKKAEAQAVVSFQVFYDNLDPFGQWIDYPNYGYVWIPMAGPDFFPYSSNGHWVFTNYGWTWVSYYNWGWAPFHYGRWSYDDYYGWFWIPDNLWGPAWVGWRTCPGYYGWAPLGPNISINIVIGDGYNAPPDQWVFLPDQYMGRNDINKYYGPRKNNQVLINNSTVINNTYVDNSSHTTYISGPRKEDVQKVIGTPIKLVEIKENSKPGQALANNQLEIYRPVISPMGNRDVKPLKISDKKDVKPISERNVENQKINEEPLKKHESKEPLIEKPVSPKSTQDNNQQKQNVPNKKTEKVEPVQQKKQPEVQPQQEKISPKPTQIDKEKKQNVPINNMEKQEPPVKQKERLNGVPPRENINPKEVPQKKQLNIAPQPVPIQKDRQERQQEQRKIEPRNNVKPPSQSIPHKEKIKETSKRPE